MRDDLAERYFAEIEADLMRERAAALRRAGDRLGECLGVCRALAEQIDATPEGSARNAEARRRYGAACRAAEDARWEFCVVREAMGLLDHTWVDRIYPRPPRR